MHHSLCRSWSEDDALQVAQAKVAEVESHMSAMRQTHLGIVAEMEVQYRDIETDMQVTIGLPSFLFF